MITTFTTITYTSIIWYAFIVFKLHYAYVFPFNIHLHSSEVHSALYHIVGSDTVDLS